MQHLPNDTFDVILDQFGQIETVYGDLGFPAAKDVWGGNDTVTATVTELNTRLTIFGDDNRCCLVTRKAETTHCSPISAAAGTPLSWWAMPNR
jgi:hypothetical protein